jgi:hypothetical integral membrane protein (TIGR02206 family)
MFFANEEGLILEFFSFWHIFQILFSALIIFLIYRYRNQIREFKYEKYIRYGSTVLGLLFFISVQTLAILEGEWTLAHNLPLNLCTISALGSAYLISSKNEKVFNVMYFWGFGAVLSVLFPDMAFGPDRYRYWEFFLAHELFMFSYLYLIFVHGFKPGVKEMLKSSLILFILAMVFILPIDLLLDANYMFLLDHGGTPLSIIHPLGPIPYLIGVVIVMFIVENIWYGPIYFYLKKANKI